MHSRMLLGGYDRELERYGVEGPRFGGRAQEMTGKSYRSAEDVEKDIINAARNDYDLRRTVEAAALSGKKKAINLQKNGFNSIDDVTNWGNFSEKAAKRHGQGGDFSSASDYMGLTKSMVQRDRNKQTAAYDETYAKTTDLNALKEKLMAEATEKAAGAGSDPIEPSERMAAVEDRLEKAAGAGSDPIEPSERMAAVEDRLEKAAGGSSNRPPSLFDKDNAQPAKADDQADAARNFLEDYTADVREGANIRSDIKTGVSNAARHVRDAYGR